MSAESRVTGETIARETTNRPWLAGIGGGLVGGIGMGLILQFVANAMPLIGSLYGQPTVLAGWVAHLIHSAIFGLIFVALVSRTGLRQYARTTAAATGLGTTYGVVLGVVTGAFVLPVWANAVAGAGLPVPMFVAAPFAGHVVFGALLGGAFALIRGAATEPEPIDEVTEVETDVDEFEQQAR